MQKINCKNWKVQILSIERKASYDIDIYIQCKSQITLLFIEIKVRNLVELSNNRDQWQCWWYLQNQDCNDWMFSLDKGQTKIQNQWEIQHLHKSIMKMRKNNYINRLSPEFDEKQLKLVNQVNQIMKSKLNVWHLLKGARWLVLPPVTIVNKKPLLSYTR